MLTFGNIPMKKEVFQSPLFGFHLKSMRLYGLIVKENQKHELWHNLRCLFFTFSLMASCGFMFVKVSHSLDNLEKAATSGATAVEYLTTTVMAFNAFLQRKRLVALVSFAHNDLAEMMANADDIEWDLYQKTVGYIRLVTSILWGPSLIAGAMAYLDLFIRTYLQPDTVFNMPQVINGTAEPILMFRLFPFGEVIDNFVIGYLGPCYALLLGITVIPLWHTFITCLMKYLTLKFEILNKRMQTMDISKITLLDVKTLSEEHIEKLRFDLCADCVKEQMKIRSFVKELESLLRFPVFMDFIMFSVLICFLLFALSNGNPSNMDYCFMFIFLFVMGSILWLYHWHATLVAESNDALRVAIYSSDWYTFSVRLQKTIRLLMMDSITPLKMRAILVELNLKTFIDIVRGAYSYFNILRNVIAR